MRYVKVAWSHDFADDPVLYLSELGDDGYETRKVQFYRDGRVEWADESHETATVGLSEIPFPALEEISSQPEFVAELIDSKEFEQAWIRSHSSS
ncbi:DUF6881 domain-containing protein [Streptomyces sp. NPDC048496]|uniref:DUF6881 domain-containing protein n=1 Tax=Streptomyces sp. NPDC048496 TaxID=3365558 RepID=UPI003719E68E